MVYGFMTLHDKTDVSHTEMREDGTVKVYFEKPVHLGFKSAECIIPGYEWENIEGFSDDEIAECLGIADELGMSSLVETHDEQQIQSAIRAGARVIGVNNRNLENFNTDLSTAERLRSFVPEGILYVVESGINSAEDARRARECGADALLVGESLMRAPDRRIAIENFRRVLHDH